MERDFIKQLSNLLNNTPDVTEKELMVALNLFELGTEET